MNVSVVGFGRFGKLLANLLYEEFGNVYIYSNDIKEIEKDERFNFVTLKEAASKDIVILSVPISSFEECLHEIIPFLKKGSLLIDVCSVKVFPTNLMKKHVPVSVNLLGAHPMWGPESFKLNGGLKGLKIVLCPLRITKSMIENITNLLEKKGFSVMIESPAEHDKKAASSQALAQFVGKILELMPLEDIDIGTMGYSQLKGLLPFVESSNNTLFYDLQNYNPFAIDVRKRFMEIALLLSSDIGKRDTKKAVNI